MNRLFFAFFAVIAMMVMVGCGRTPIRTAFPAALPPHRAETDLSAARAAALKNMLAPAEVRGVGVFPAAFAGHFSDEELLDAVVACGFNRLYCQLTSEQELDSRLANLISAANARHIPVELVFSQQDFYRRYQTNRIIRPLMADYPDLVAVVAEAVEFNEKSLPENIRIAGITVILAPQMFTASHPERLHGRLYSWDDKHYGIGGDNDMLVRESLETVMKIADIPNMLPLTVAVPDFLHNAAVEGKLSCGKVTDFLACADVVAVISSANLPSKVPVAVQDEFAAAAEQNEKIITVIPLAGHTSVDSGRLRRRNWLDFQRTTNNFMKKTADSKAFGGVIITPMAVVEYLRQEI